MVIRYGITMVDPSALSSFQVRYGRPLRLKLYDEVVYESSKPYATIMKHTLKGEHDEPADFHSS